MALLDDMLNYIIERCVKIKFPTGTSSWRDIKEVDRFYLLLAIREYTFINGDNKLQVLVSDSKTIDVKKEMIDYLKIGPELLKYYDPDTRCFILNFKETGSMRLTLPSVGVTNWIKNYVIRKRQAQEPMDEDFIPFAPFVILDWRGLADNTYQQYAIQSNNWSVLQISALTEIQKILVEAIEPVVKYNDEQGGERVIPLRFPNGIKSIFLIPNPLSKLG